MDLIELSRRLENLIRIGTINSVDHSAARVRVRIGQLITQWLPWLEHRAGETTTWDPPTPGEQVTILSPSGELGGGIVLRGLHSAAIQPPSHSPDTHVMRFPDGAVITYDHAAGHLEASGIQTGRLEAAVSITLDTPLTHCTGQLTVDDLLTYNNGLAGSGGANNNIVTGHFTHSLGNLSSNGKILHSHTHTGVQPGASNTGLPT